MAFDVRLFSGIGIFATIVETGNFTKAGAAIGLTSSGVSRAVSRLEQRLGVRLFDRSPKAVSLTPEGRAFHLRVIPLLDEAEAAAVDAGGLKVSLSGRLRICADLPSAYLILAPLLPSWQVLYPDLTVEIVVKEAMGDLVSEGFDAVVRFGETEARGLNVHLLGHTRILTVASPNFLAGKGKPSEPSDLDMNNCISMRDPLKMAPYLWKFISKNKIVTSVPKSGLFINDGVTLKAACIAGCGIGQLLEIEVIHSIENGELVPLFPEWHEEYYPLYLYTLPGTVKSRRVNFFIEFLISKCSGVELKGFNGLG